MSDTNPGKRFQPANKPSSAVKRTKRPQMTGARLLAYSHHENTAQKRAEEIPIVLSQKRAGRHYKMAV
jgi:hypothetical protein